MKAQSKSETHIQKLLASLKAKGMSTPTEIHWLEFYDFLLSKNYQNKLNPPVPLILAASAESNASKHCRLSKQLEWAQSNGCLDEAILHLEQIPAEQWNLCSQSQWYKDSYPHFSYGKTSDPKPQMNDEFATNLIEFLRIKWDEIAGPELSGITLPINFSGPKGGRLVVYAKCDATPPWGTWTTLDGGDNRIIFTRLRASVNATISPNEVDHIDFVHKFPKHYSGPKI